MSPREFLLATSNSVRRLPFRLHKVYGTAAVLTGTALFGRRLYLEHVEHVDPESLRFRAEGVMDVWNYWNNAAWSLVAGAVISAATVAVASREEFHLGPEEQETYARRTGIASVLALNVLSETSAGQYILQATELGNALMLASQPHFSDFAAGVVCGAIGSIAFRAKDTSPGTAEALEVLDERVQQL